jgi:radical SAM protein with 4Fe4S-binding SPASM domain
MSSTAVRLDWVDAFVDRIRPYVHVRLADRVLIRMPNQAYKLNRTGTRILHYLLKGGSIQNILNSEPADSVRPEQLYSFFTDLSRMLSSAICDMYQSPSLERVNFALGYIELPVLSEVALTWRCNIACRFCYAACGCTSEPGENTVRKELTTDEFKKVLMMIRHDAQVPSVSFTGGEPALRADLSELVAYAAGSLGMRVNLISNGTLITSPLAKDLKEAGLASAQISIESPDPEVHDRIVRRKGAFEASVDGLKALKEAGVTVHPHATLCRLNLHTIARMPYFARELGVDRFSLNMIIPAGRGLDRELTIKYADIKEIILTIKAEAESAGIQFMWYSPTPVCLFNPIPHQLGNKGCSACEGLLSVDPYGRVLPCSSWKEPLGSLLEDGFETVWFSERGKALRDKRAAHPECRACEHFAVCHGACPLYFHAYGYEELRPALDGLKNNATPCGRNVQ